MAQNINWLQLCLEYYNLILIAAVNYELSVSLWVKISSAGFCQAIILQNTKFQLETTKNKIKTLLVLWGNCTMKQRTEMSLH